MTILVYTFAIILSFLLVIILIFFVLWIFGGFKNRVPFIPVSKKSLPKIYESLGINSNSVVYDLGAGDSRVLFYLSQKEPKAKYIGIENNPMAVLLSKAGSWFNFKKTQNRVKILNQNFFEKDISDATHVFLYLFPEIMDKLQPKLEKELKNGTIVVSATFSFSNKEPIKVINLDFGKYSLIHKIFIYKF